MTDGIHSVSLRRNILRLDILELTRHKTFGWTELTFKIFSHAKKKASCRVKSNERKFQTRIFPRSVCVCVQVTGVEFSYKWSKQTEIVVKLQDTFVALDYSKTFIVGWRTTGNSVHDNEDTINNSRISEIIENSKNNKYTLNGIK